MLHEDRPFHDGSFLNWAEKPSRDFPFHYSDGVSIRLAETDENPDDEFLGSGVIPGSEPEDDADEAEDGERYGDVADHVGEA